MAETQPEERAEARSWDLNPDVASLIANLLLEEKSPFYDEADLARDACALLCVGNASFTLIGEQLCRAICPHMHEEVDVDEKSTSAALKAVLKKWGLSGTGNKAELWRRIQDEIDVPEDLDRNLCPISAACRARIKAINTSRVSKSKAADMYHLPQNEVEALPREILYSPMGYYYTYSVKQIKALARARYPFFGAYRELTGRNRAGEQVPAYMPASESHSVRRQKLANVLKSRGLTDADVSRGFGHFWWLDYISSWGRGSETTDTKLEEAAQLIIRWLWFQDNTEHAALVQQRKQGYEYKKSPSKYKQGITLEVACFSVAAERWVVGKESLQQALAATPSSVHPFVQSAWAKMRR